jgi:hypothetical protein
MGGALAVNMRRTVVVVNLLDTGLSALTVNVMVLVMSAAPGVPYRYDMTRYYATF